MSWMAEMASYRYLGELKRRYRDLELRLHDARTRDAAPYGERADAAAARTVDDLARRQSARTG